MNKWPALGGTLALIAVMMGAFGAHALEARADPHLLEVFRTGAYYQMVHAIGLILIGQRLQQRPHCRLLKLSCVLLTIGIIVFSGSLYLRVLLDQPKWGMITPLGGLSFMIGWALYVASEVTGTPPAEPGL